MDDDGISRPTRELRTWIRAGAGRGALLGEFLGLLAFHGSGAPRLAVSTGIAVIAGAAFGVVAGSLASRIERRSDATLRGRSVARRAIVLTAPFGFATLLVIPVALGWPISANLVPVLGQTLMITALALAAVGVRLPRPGPTHRVAPV